MKKLSPQNSDTSDALSPDNLSYSARLYVTFEVDNSTSSFRQSPQPSISSSENFLSPDAKKSELKVKKTRGSIFVWNRETITRDLIKRRRSIGDPSELRRMEQFNKVRHITEVGEFTEAVSAFEKPHLPRSHSTHLEFLAATPHGQPGIQSLFGARTSRGRNSYTFPKKVSSETGPNALPDEGSPIDFPGRRKASTASLERLDIEQKAGKAVLLEESDTFMGDDESDSDTSIESQEDIPIKARISVRKPDIELDPPAYAKE
jgi:hypothetical protein